MIRAIITYLKIYVLTPGRGLLFLPGLNSFAHLVRCIISEIYAFADSQQKAEPPLRPHLGPVLRLGWNLSGA